MTVYLLWECYYDNCNTFETLVDVYQNEVEARKECVRLSSKVPKKRQDYEYFRVYSKELK